MKHSSDWNHLTIKERRNGIVYIEAPIHMAMKIRDNFKNMRIGHNFAWDDKHLTALINFEKRDLLK